MLVADLEFSFYFSTSSNSSKKELWCLLPPPPILSSSTLTPTHSPRRAMSSCLTPHKALMLWLSSKARPPLFFLSLYDLSLPLTNLLWLLLPLFLSVYVPYCSLPRGRRNVRARSQVLCLTAGRGSLSHCVCSVC